MKGVKVLLCSLVPSNPSADHFQYLARDTGSDPRWGCLSLGTILTFVLVIVTTTAITVLCMPGSPYWSLVGNKQARNRWLVAYTLLRNPSLQELTASRIEEKKPQEVVAMGETDPGLEAESSDIKQPLWNTVKEANFEVTS